MLVEAKLETLSYRMAVRYANHSDIVAIGWNCSGYLERAFVVHLWKYQRQMKSNNSTPLEI